jgi:hypothetical protein
VDEGEGSEMSETEVKVKVIYAEASKLEVMLNAALKGIPYLKLVGWAVVGFPAYEEGISDYVMVILWLLE